MLFIAKRITYAIKESKIIKYIARFRVALICMLPIKMGIYKISVGENNVAALAKPRAVREST